MTESAPKSAALPDWNAYQRWTDSTAIYPAAGQKTLQSLTYCALGLAGESGEAVEKIKKLLRDGDGPEQRELLGRELGDVLWYVARLARELDLPLEDVVRTNIEKLESRQWRETLQGAGDMR